MKKFVLRTIYVSLPLLIIIIIVNYFGDAGRIFTNEYEKKIATILLENKLATNIDNFDERLLQEELINRWNKPINTLILGSSRTMLLNKDNLKDSSLLNNSVSGASLEDLIAIYQLHRNKKTLPKKVIIGIDPWTFNINHGQSRWKSISKYYSQFLGETKENDSYFSKYMELISLSYFQNSLKFIPDVIKGNNEPIATDSMHNVTNTKLPDGSLIYSNDYRNSSQAKINNKIDLYLSNELYSIENYNELSKKYWLEFEKLITTIKAEHSKIEIFLCPYAPQVYDVVEKKYIQVVETEKKLLEFVKVNSIKLHGSFNPYLLGLDSTDFYDGMHCKEKAINQIINVSTFF